MGKFSSEEIESQYNLIKKLLAEPEKYEDAINAIKKDIEYMPIELKEKLEEENIFLWMNRKGIDHDLWFLKLVNSHSRKLTERV